MKSVLALALSVATTSSAFAGGPVVVITEPEPMPVIMPAAPVSDWAGAYVGLGYGTSSGDIDFTPAPARELESGNAASIFAGYLWQRNAFVYGAELAYTSLQDNTVTGFPTFEVSNSIDLKGRFGVAANRMLFYGVIGYSMATYDEGSAGWDPSGMNYGIGMDYQISDRMTFGLEYLARNLSADNPNGLGQSVDIDLDTVSLRVGFRF